MALFESLYQKGNTVIVVTHEADIARHARRRVHLRDGVIESDEMVPGATSLSLAAEVASLGQP